MTEGEWLTSKDPYFMYLGLQHAKLPVSDRKWRLFCCACMRLTRKKSSWEVPWLTHWEIDGQPMVTESLGMTPVVVPSWTDLRGDDSMHKHKIADTIREIIGNPFHRYYRTDDDNQKQGSIWYFPVEWITPTVSSLAQDAYNKRRSEKKVWTCKDQGKHSHTGLAGSMAHGVFHSVNTRVPHHHHDEKCSFFIDTDGFLDQPKIWVLADALIDAGCTNKIVLDHLRNENSHVRGCWVLDLLLGKE